MGHADSCCLIRMAVLLVSTEMSRCPFWKASKRASKPKDPEMSVDTDRHTAYGWAIGDEGGRLIKIAGDLWRLLIFK